MCEDYIDLIKNIKTINRFKDDEIKNYIFGVVNKIAKKIKKGS